jgi:hypothetical protein
MRSVVLVADPRSQDPYPRREKADDISLARGTDRLTPSLPNDGIGTAPRLQLIHAAIGSLPQRIPDR